MARLRWQATQMTTPKNGHPLVAQLFSRMVERDYSYDEVAYYSGINKETLRGWRDKNPNLVNFVAVANSLGFDVVLQEQRV